MKQWVHKRDFYTRIQLNTKKFSSRQYIIVIEAKALTVKANNVVELEVMVSECGRICMNLIF